MQPTKIPTQTCIFIPHTPKSHRLLQPTDQASVEAVAADQVLSEAVAADPKYDQVLVEAVAADQVLSEAVAADQVLLEAVAADQVLLEAVAADQPTQTLHLALPPAGVGQPGCCGACCWRLHGASRVNLILGDARGLFQLSGCCSRPDKLAAAADQGIIRISQPLKLKGLLQPTGITLTLGLLQPTGITLTLDPSEPKHCFALQGTACGVEAGSCDQRLSFASNRYDNELSIRANTRRTRVACGADCISFFDQRPLASCHLTS